MLQKTPGGNAAVGLFPGQGIAAEAVLEALDAHREQVHEARSVLGRDLGEELRRAVEDRQDVPSTALMQPAIYTASVALFNAHHEIGEFSFLAGHSLGEYAALTAAGSLAFHDALTVLMARSEAMDLVARESPGGMAAVLRLPVDVVEGMASTAGVTIANDNAPGQIVASGSHEGLERLGEMAVAEGGKYVKLTIAGPYHSEAVTPAVPILESALRSIDIQPAKVPVISNVTARPFGDPEDIRRLLVGNLVNGVRWRETLSWLWDEGVKDHVDIGPGQVVGKLARQVFASCRAAEAPEDRKAAS